MSNWRDQFTAAARKHESQDDYFYTRQFKTYQEEEPEPEPEPPKMTTNNQLTFQPGKFYKTRDGRKARIYATDGGSEFPIHGAAYNESENRWGTDSWTPDGRRYVSFETSGDLIAEWKDAPEVDWSKMPAWANYVAMDGNGKWFWFLSTPRQDLDRNSWVNSINGDDIGEIPPTYVPKWSGDWRESLVTREAQP